MAMCVSGSGGSRMTRSLPLAIDHPEGTVKFAPPGVACGESAETRSGVPCCWAGKGFAELALGTIDVAMIRAATAKRKKRARSIVTATPQENTVKCGTTITQR